MEKEGERPVALSIEVQEAIMVFEAMIAYVESKSVPDARTEQELFNYGMMQIMSQNKEWQA